MIRKGSLVRRRGSKYCIHLRRDILAHDYPPENEVCIVVAFPKEKDLAYQERRIKAVEIIALKKTIDVICNGRLFGPCDMLLFDEVKGEG